MRYQDLKQSTISNKDLKAVFSRLNLTIQGDATIPKAGRIAINLMVPTYEKGNILIRAYPENMPDKLETGLFNFEVRVLNYLNKYGLRVPSLLPFSDGTFLYRHNGHVYMAYVLIPGNTLEKKDLSLDIAQKSGVYMAQLTKAAVKFVPTAYEELPKGDIEHIKKSFVIQSKKIPEMLENLTFKAMLDFVTLEEISILVHRSPKDIVHSDFFFENFIVDGQHTAAIDFGDAYYGSVVMDIAIAAMEFSAVYDQNWDFNFLKEFLKPNLEWLKTNRFSAKDFVHLMKINCLRFAIYTAPSISAESISLDKNPYVLRFHYLSHPDIVKAIKNAFS